MARRPSMASQADKYRLYEAAVQDPTLESRLHARVYRDAIGRDAKVLREDFCGTAAVCEAWVTGKPERRAMGIDLDGSVLAWSRKNRLAAMPEAARARVQLVKGNVLSKRASNADIIAASNFSFFTFHTRSDLLRYAKALHAGLAKQGVAILEMMGGPDLMMGAHVDTRRVKSFRYCWERELYDPITHLCDFHIHFEFKDDSALVRAFSYHWRLWTIAEVREVLMDAGFDDTCVYWAQTDRKNGGGNGVYTRREKTAPDRVWLAYVVGIKR